jgi:hypothetical protein
MAPPSQQAPQGYGGQSFGGFIPPQRVKRTTD